ncbi:Hypothetical predicted protein [Xyrichtys novacula]|uniref:Uncharacterized protein n=1 Tax=Xyrichtys novacula TaxID=13765 RepID=A0AAV1HS68_XYRNO|nr:Hypothetical predicted protein [Xyrichtys novacula]
MVAVVAEYGGNLAQSCAEGMTSLGGLHRKSCTRELRLQQDWRQKRSRNESRIPSPPSFLSWRVMERSKSTAVSQVGPGVKASGDGGGCGEGWGGPGGRRRRRRRWVGVGEDRALTDGVYLIITCCTQVGGA